MGRGMMPKERAEKLVDGAMSVVGTAAGLVRHVAWYLSYHVGGGARGDEPPSRPRRRPRG